MKKAYSCVLLFGLFFCANTIASDTTGPYFGLKYGRIEGSIFLSSESMSAVTLGYDFGRFGLEYEQIRGKFTELPPFVILGPTPSNSERTTFKVRGDGLFATYRLGRTWNFKSKIGVMDQNFKPDYLNDDGLKFATGVGLGIDWTYVRLDFDATYVKDGNSYLSAGLLFKIDISD